MIGSLYDAAAGRERWETFLHGLAQATGADAAALFTPWPQEGDGLLYAYGFPAAMRGRPRGNGQGRAGDRALSISPESARNGDGTYSFCGAVDTLVDAVGPGDFHHVLSWVIAAEAHPLLPSVHLDLYRPAGQPDFGASEKQKLEWLQPHLERALAIRAELEAGRAMVRGLRNVIARIATPIVALRAGGRVALVNPPAAQLLAAEDGLLLRGGELRAQTGQDQASLQRTLRFVTVEAAGGGDWDVPLTISRPSGKRGYLLFAAPVPSPTPATARDAVAGTVCIIDPEPGAPERPEWVGRILGLTRSEARLAAALACGETLAQYAAQAGITLGTARWTLKQAMHKTGSDKQAALVALVLRASMVRSDDER